MAWEKITGKCRKCAAMEILHETWKSSCGGYVDEHYKCPTCGYSWWVEGPDS